MMKSLALSCIFFVGASAMCNGGMGARPVIGAAQPKAAKAQKVAEPIEDQDLSLSIPFAPRPTKLDGTMLGDVGFDPLGLSNLWDLNWLRAAELKHGRIGMLASIGFLAQEGYRLPGPASNPGLFAVAKTPIEAITTAPTLGLAQIIGVIFLIELATSGKLLDTESFFEEGEEPTEKAPAGSGRPGDLGWDPLGLSADGLNGDYAIAELKHGRLGMLGAAGMLAGSLISGKSVSEQTYEWLSLPFNA